MKIIEPTPAEYDLVCKLADIHALTFMGRKRVWIMNLDVSQSEKQAWLRVARFVLRKYAKRGLSATSKRITKKIPYVPNAVKTRPYTLRPIV